MVQALQDPDPGPNPPPTYSVPITHCTITSTTSTTIRRTITTTISTANTTTISTTTATSHHSNSDSSNTDTAGGSNSGGANATTRGGGPKGKADDPVALRYARRHAYKILRRRQRRLAEMRWRERMDDRTGPTVDLGADWSGSEGGGSGERLRDGGGYGNAGGPMLDGG